MTVMRFRNLTLAFQVAQGMMVASFGVTVPQPITVVAAQADVGRAGYRDFGSGGPIQPCRDRDTYNQR